MTNQQRIAEIDERLKQIGIDLGKLPTERKEDLKPFLLKSASLSLSARELNEDKERILNRKTVKIFANSFDNVPSHGTIVEQETKKTETKTLFAALGWQNQ